MKTWFNQLSVSKKLNLSMLLSIGALLLIAVIFMAILNQVKIGGPIEKKISKSAVLNSYVAPPALYAIESKEALVDAIFTTNNLVERKRLIGVLVQKQREFEEAYTLEKSEVKELKEIEGLELSYKSGLEYYKAINQKCVPILVGLGRIAKCEELLHTEFQNLFEIHRTASINLTSLTSENIKLYTSEAQKSVQTIIIVLIILILLFMSAIFWLARSVKKSVIDPIETTEDYGKPPKFR